MPFTFKKLRIPEVILVEPKTFPDERGFFMEAYKNSDFENNGIIVKFVQDNFSYSKKRVLRGLHYQKTPQAQAKLVTAITGEIFDVAVDLRKDSPTFGKWVAEILSDSNHRSLFIPEGFAHGFCVLSEIAHVSYKVNREYSSEHERGIIWNDPKINIQWPTNKPIINQKDLQLPILDNIDNNFEYQ